MLNADMNYPYPVIRAYPEDYKDTIFKGTLAVNVNQDCYLVKPDFEIQNDEITALIAEGKMTYAIEVQSPATWFRKLFVVHDNESISLDPICLHEYVELIPCIVATVPIPSFSNKDFSEEYQGINFNIKAGDVIAIGEKRSFDALYQNDIIKNGSSIVDIVEDRTAKEISCTFDSNKIKIMIPSEQYADYTDCGYVRRKHKILNAVLVVPALVRAIGLIEPDREFNDYSDNAWYKTIVVNLKRVANASNGKKTYPDMLKDPVTCAELLLNNNYAAVLEFIKELD